MRNQKKYSYETINIWVFGSFCGGLNERGDDGLR